MENIQTIPENISKREYIKKYADKKFYRGLRMTGIFCYVMYVVLFVLQIFWLPLTSLERIICLGLTLGIHLGKSKVCAIILLVFGSIEMIAGSLVLGFPDPTGIVCLVISISSLCLFNKADRQFRALQGEKN